MPRIPDYPHMVTVEDVVDETPTVRTLAFTDRVMSDALPGQFAMVWVPGAGEMPMSVMVRDGTDKAAFTVRRHGPTSTGLFDTRPGEKIGLRGPYGNSFDLRRGRLLLVGGGTGLVPLMRMLRFTQPQDEITVLIGARTREEVFFEDVAGEMLKGRPHRIVVVTDDGSYGRSGLVTDAVKDLLGEGCFDAVYTCGPEIMMYKTVQAACSGGIFVQASLERMMKCGMGICGSCCMDRYLACRDGTVFDGGDLLLSTEFGRTYRNKAGIPTDYTG